MIPLSVFIDGDNCWTDLKKDDSRILHFGPIASVARLPMGTASGRSSIAFRVDLPDGRVVIGETTLALLKAAMAAFEGAEQREQEAKE